MNPWSVLACLVLVALGLAVGFLVGVLWARSRPEHVDAITQGRVEMAEVMGGLDRLHDQMLDLDHQRASWQGQLREQVLDMRHTTDSLRRETRALSTALRRPQVRGRWGELHLRRAVELAGLVEHCDFAEQARLDDGALRPDLVVSLSGGRQVVVDAKVPLDAYLDAVDAAEPTSPEGEPDAAAHEHHLRRHARQVRAHVDALAAKAYWRALPDAPAFVVMFVPSEAVLAAALEVDRDLLEHASARQVVLASPTTLIALLRTVAHGWSHERLADRAAEIHRLGRELHGRLRVVAGHLDHLGRALDTTVSRYNQTVGSLESRVLVTARRFDDLAPDDDLVTPRGVGLRAVRRAADDEEARDPSVAQ